MDRQALTDRHLRGQLTPHVAAAHQLISRRLDDAHALAAIGEVGKARERLAELRDGLADEQGGGLIGDAKSEFLLASAGDLNAQLRQSLEINPEARQTARRARIAGSHHAAEAHQLAADAARDLGAAAQAPADMRTGALSTWRVIHRNRLEVWAGRALSDSQIALHHAARRLAD